MLIVFEIFLNFAYFIKIVPFETSCYSETLSLLRQTRFALKWKPFHEQAVADRMRLIMFKTRYKTWF